jgi:hypothetical protein
LIGTEVYKSKEEFIELLPTPKIHKNYKFTWKFQIDWSAKAPWNEIILIGEGLLYMVNCSICTAKKVHLVIMDSKKDIVKRHRKRICHVKNTRLCTQRMPTTGLQ